MTDPDECDFDIYKKDCTSRKYFEKQGYLKDYRPVPEDTSGTADSLRQAQEECKSLCHGQAQEECKSLCHGYYYHDGIFETFSEDQARYFCKRKDNLVILKEKRTTF